MQSHIAIIKTKLTKTHLHHVFKDQRTRPLDHYQSKAHNHNLFFFGFPCYNKCVLQTQLQQPEKKLRLNLKGQEPN